ncbi:MAG: OmpA family protein, partial [Gallionella sp.]
NLALGQRRANNVKKLLILSGAKASQIETISFGEEKPRCSEHNEACWSQNRRADIDYLTK